MTSVTLWITFTWVPTGLKVSRICLGMMTYGSPDWHPWTLDEAASRPFIKRALERGITFFDTADMYSRGASEEVLGRALKDFAKRDQVVVATKVCQPMGDGPNDRGLSRKHLLDAIDASLRRLGMDYVDLYQIHRFDYDTPIEETLEALHDIVKSGKARYIGASSMYAWQFAKMLAVAEARGWSRFVSMQNHLNLVYREEEREMMPLCRAEGHRRHSLQPDGARVPGRRPEEAGRRRHRARQQRQAGREVLFRGLRLRDCRPRRRTGGEARRQPHAGRARLGAVASRRDRADHRRRKLPHLDEAIDALDVKLTPEECKFLEEIYQPHPVVGPL